MIQLINTSINVKTMYSIIFDKILIILIYELNYNLEDLLRQLLLNLSY